MRLPTFIRLENTLEEAMAYRNSHDMALYSFNGVHLLPNQAYPYTQRTYSSTGISLEGFTVQAFTLCGDPLQFITESFIVEQAFNDPDTGLPQIYWSLKNVDRDFGDQLIYLVIETGLDGYVYSTPFKLTAEGADRTGLLHYRNSINDRMLSTSLEWYYRMPADDMEISNYTPVATGNPFTATSRLSSYEIWETGIIDIYTFRRIKEVFTLRYRYLNFDFVSLREAFETPRLQGVENFGQQEITLFFDSSKRYDPFYVPPIPPDPPVNPPTITLNSVDSVSPDTVRFNFSYANFSPSYLTLQYAASASGPWLDTNSNTGSTVSPRTMNAPNNLNAGYYYRIFYADLNLASNIRQLANPSILITNVICTDPPFKTTGNSYSIYYTLTSISSSPATQAQVSVDGVNWVTAYFTAVPNTNPRLITTPASAVEFKYFRLKYAVLPYVSNSYFYEIP